jgi:hypothetical protein
MQPSFTQVNCVVALRAANRLCVGQHPCPRGNSRAGPHALRTRS